MANILLSIFLFITFNKGFETLVICFAMKKNILKK